MTDIQTTLARAIAGRPAPARWAVEGTNARDETFRIDRYQERWQAADFAAEVIAKGGTARVVKAVAR